MKPFQRFAILAVAPIALFATVAILLGRSLENLQNFYVNLITVGYFTIVAFCYEYVYRNFFKHDNEVKSVFIGAMATFFASLAFGRIVMFFHTNISFEVLFLQATLMLCVFLFYVGFFKIYAASSFKNTVRFTEKWSQNVILLLISSCVTAILFFIFSMMPSMIGYLTPVQILKEALLIIAFSAVLNFSAFAAIYSVNRNSYFRQHILIGAALASIAAFCVNMLSLEFIFNRIYIYSVHTFLFTVLIVVVLYSALLFRNSKGQVTQLTYAAASTEAEYQKLKRQIDPHFLFNNLNTMISFISSEPTKAIEFGHSLANIYRHSLDQQHEDFVPLQDELDFIMEYLHVYRTKFSDDLLVDINCSVQPGKYIVAATLQELIDNIFKHNQTSCNAPLKIQISAEHNFLDVRNTRNPKTSQQTSGTGLQNIAKRYKILTQQDVIINASENMFSVKIPILSVQS